MLIKCVREMNFSVLIFVLQFLTPLISCQSNRETFNQQSSEQALSQNVHNSGVFLKQFSNKSFGSFVSRYLKIARNSNITTTTTSRQLQYQDHQHHTTQSTFLSRRIRKSDESKN